MEAKDIKCLEELLELYSKGEHPINVEYRQALQSAVSLAKQIQGDEKKYLEIIDHYKQQLKEMGERTGEEKILEALLDYYSGAIDVEYLRPIAQKLSQHIKGGKG